MSFMPQPVMLMDKSTRSLTCDTCFLRCLLHATIEGLCLLCMVRVKKIQENMGMGIHFT
jgi:hypothetical protein